MPLAKIVFGGILLVFGKKVFWLFVGLCGFALGIGLATRFFEPRSTWLALLLALALGVLGAVLATQIPRIAVGLAGFLGGALAAISLAGWLGVAGGFLGWVLVLVGGILGTLILAAAFEWGLILLSSLAGASLVVEGLQLTQAAGWLGLIGLFVVGVVAQAVWMRSEKH
jgi:hypothetical protein